MRLLEYNYLKDNISNAEFQDASQVLGSLRLKKDAVEIESMRKAVKVSYNFV